MCFSILELTFFFSIFLIQTERILVVDVTFFKNNMMNSLRRRQKQLEKRERVIELYILSFSPYSKYRDY